MITMIALFANFGIRIYNANTFQISQSSIIVLYAAPNVWILARKDLFLCLNNYLEDLFLTTVNSHPL